jgi:hypothetical protein
MDRFGMLPYAAICDGRPEDVSPLCKHLSNPRIILGSEARCHRLRNSWGSLPNLPSLSP